jgi:hypothetical protein
MSAKVRPDFLAKAQQVAHKHYFQVLWKINMFDGQVLTERRMVGLSWLSKKLPVVRFLLLSRLYFR